MKKLTSHPTISVVTPTFNSGRLLDRCLESVRNQRYPQDKIEILLGDGGSNDNTYEVASRYKAKFFPIPPKKQRSEYNRAIAFNKSKGKYVLILDHDNFLPHKNWLLDMVLAMEENPNAVAIESSHYDYKKSYKLMDRYFALFGTSEPLPFYLGKADRLMQTQHKWNLLGEADDCGKYYKVRFEKNPLKFPSIGTNGCLLRSKILKKFADTRPSHHYPIDVMVDVLLKGNNEFLFYKNSIIHLTHSKGLWEFLKRRFVFVDRYYIEENKNRRWSVFMKGDEFKLVKFIIYSLTLIKPTYDAVRGYLIIPDIAWFIHPLMCLGTTFLYSYAFIRRKIE